MAKRLVNYRNLIWETHHMSVFSGMWVLYFHHLCRIFSDYPVEGIRCCAISFALNGFCKSTPISQSSGSYIHLTQIDLVLIPLAIIPSFHLRIVKASWSYRHAADRPRTPTTFGSLYRILPFLKSSRIPSCTITRTGSTSKQGLLNLDHLPTLGRWWTMMFKIYNLTSTRGN